MNALGWMHRKFRQNNDEQSRNVSTRKSYSCFSALSELDEQQYYPEPKNNSSGFRQPRVCSESSIALKSHGVEEVNEEKTVDMSLEFFHGFLAIGTLGSVSINAEPMRPQFATEKETEETEATEKKLQSPKLIEKEVHDLHDESSKGSFLDSVVTSSNKAIKSIDIKDKAYPLKEFSEMPVTKEEAKVKYTSPFKKNVTSYKRSGKSDKGKKRGTHAFHFMKKMLKKIDFTSRSSPTSASGNAIVSDSTEKKLTNALQRSGKIHPETAGVHVTTSHNYEVKDKSYDEGYENDVTSDEEDNTCPHGGMLKKEIDNGRIFPNRPLDSLPAGKKAYWIKTDADYLVLEF